VGGSQGRTAWRIFAVPVFLVVSTSHVDVRVLASVDVDLEAVPVEL